MQTTIHVSDDGTTWRPLHTFERAEDAAVAFLYGVGGDVRDAADYGLDVEMGIEYECRTALTSRRILLTTAELVAPVAFGSYLQAEAE